MALFSTFCHLLALVDTGFGARAGMVEFGGAHNTGFEVVAGLSWARQVQPMGRDIHQS